MCATRGSPRPPGRAAETMWAPAAQRMEWTRRQASEACGFSGPAGTPRHSGKLRAGRSRPAWRSPRAVRAAGAVVVVLGNQAGKAPAGRNVAGMCAHRASTREDMIDLWGYDAIADVGKLNAAVATFSRQPWTVKAALAFALGLLFLGVGDLLGWKWVNDLGRQQVATTVMAEAGLLVIVFFIVDEALERRRRKEWDSALSSVIPGLVTNAQLTRRVFEDGYKDLDSERKWERFQRSAAGFAEHVRGANWMMSLAPDVAELWTRVATLAREYEHLATARAQDIKPLVGTELFEQKRDRFRTRTIELIYETDHYQEAWHEELVKDALEHPALDRYRQPT